MMTCKGFIHYVLKTSVLEPNFQIDLIADYNLISQRRKISELHLGFNGSLYALMWQQNIANG